MTNSEWTASKVAQIGNLQEKLAQRDSQIVELAKLLEATRIEAKEAQESQAIWREAYHDTCDRAYQAEQKVEKLEAELIALYQAAQDGVCKKCAKVEHA